MTMSMMTKKEVDEAGNNDKGRGGCRISNDEVARCS